MPYVDEEVRRALNEGAVPVQPGALNYVLSQEINDYIEEYGLNYQTINDVIGVLECLKFEVYRRLAVPYEDMKCYANGDVFTVEVPGG